MEFSAYITNLGKYNEGELIGEWVEFPCDEGDFEDVLARIGISSEYEEWFVTDYECELRGFNWEDLGEYPSYDALQDFGYMLEGIDDPEAVDNIAEDVGDLVQAVEIYNKGDYIYLPGVSDNYELGAYYLENGLADLSTLVNEGYIDYGHIGRDIEIEFNDEDEEGNPITAGEYFCGDMNATPEEIGETAVSEGFIDEFQLESYIDVEAFGRDISYDGTFTSDGFVEVF